MKVSYVNEILERFFVKKYFKKWNGWSLFLLFALTSCVTAVSTPSGTEVKKSVVWLDQAGTFEIIEAWLDRQDLYFRFRVYSPERNSVSEQATRVDGVVTEGLSLEKPLLEARSFVLLTQKQWVDRPEDMKSVMVLGSQYLNQFYQSLFEAITPQESQTAARVTFASGDKVVYYGDDGGLNLVDITDKPEKEEIQRSYTLPEFSDLLVGSLQDYMQQQNNWDQHPSWVILSVPREQVILDPFVLVDLERGNALSLRLFDSRLERYRESLIKQGLKTIDQLVWNSHFLGLIRRPVSSAWKLLVTGVDSGYEVINPRLRALFENEPPPDLFHGDFMDREEFEASLDKITGTQLQMGSLSFMIGGDTFFPELIKQLRAAEKSIQIRIFIFDRDDWGVQIADILKEKSRQGVKVKVLLDSVGIIMGENHLSPDLPVGFIPPASMVDYLREDSKVKVRVSPSPWLRADHVKTVIIDESLVYTGGMNIGREYRYDWHDMMMAMHGSVNNVVIKEFYEAWAHASALGDFGYFFSRMVRPVPVLKSDGEYPIRVLMTRLGQPQIYRAQLAAIRSARRRIYIHNPYFSDTTILFELIRARRRGVDVRVIMPRRGNHEIMNAGNVVTANVLLKNGIRVFRYPGMTHVKAAIYDGWLCAGSANFDKLSLKDNIELNVATSDLNTVERMNQLLFVPDFESSEELIEPLSSSPSNYFAKFFANQL